MTKFYKKRLSLKDHIIQNGMKLRCPGCKKNLYKYTGDFSGIVDAKNFIPLKGVPKPQKYQKMLCPFCNHILALDNLEFRLKYEIIG